ncbi:MAG: hypothetical protein MZV65_19970 [Chromatiales bacterium]|nr:hypothetical protein [Chromatiales bacterium]
MEPLAVAGIRLGTTRAGIKYRRPPRSGGHRGRGRNLRRRRVHPQCAFARAPVIVARAHLAAAYPRYLVINTGNANAGTGRQGLVDARRAVGRWRSRPVAAARGGAAVLDRRDRRTVAARQADRGSAGGAGGAPAGRLDRGGARRS